MTTGEGLGCPTIDTNFVQERYDALFIDAYGVLVDAHGVLPGAPEFVRSLHQRRIPFCIVTNDAAKSLARIAARFDSLGLAIDESQIVSSASLLPAYLQGADLAGHEVCVIGPQDAHDFVAAGGARPVVPKAARPTSTSAIVLCDLTADLAGDVTAAMNVAMARIDAGRPVELVLCNPDVIYPAGKEFGLTSGAMMLMLEGALKSRYQPSELPPIKRLGKPYREIFAAARHKVEGERIALLGDQLPTDIQGALDYGIEAVLVGTGLTKPKPEAPLTPMPTFYLPSVATCRR